jgi:glutamate-1-semialdehyde aminotransferase
VPRGLEGTTFPFEYNNLPALEAALEAHRGEVACVIMEAARSYTPQPGYLEGVRDLTRKHGVILIFDEVVTGFRVSRGGAQSYYGVTPDMATFAKCISNGFALGAVAGRREIMEVALDTFISSVYWAEATGLAACRATLREYLDRDICGAVRRFGEAFMDGCRRVIAQCGAPMKVIGLPWFPSLALEGIDAEMRDPLVTLYMQETARRGVYSGPGGVFCYEHTEEDLRRGLEIAGHAIEAIAKAVADGDPRKFLEVPVRQSGFKRLV